MAVLMIGVRSSRDPRGPIQNGFWGIKFILIFFGWIGALWIPHGSFGPVMMWFGMIFRPLKNIFLPFRNRFWDFLVLFVLKIGQFWLAFTKRVSSQPLQIKTKS